jgi:hypothetical protein
VGPRQLARDSGVTGAGGWDGVTLAHNVRSLRRSTPALARAQVAGATGPLRRGHLLGGYSGVFIDPDGHPWEVAHNAGWTVHEDDRTTLD